MIAFALMMCACDADGKTDVLPGFQNPPPGYGEVPFWWWTGDPLDKERLLWQIEELHQKGIAGVQVNYAHQDTPGWPTYPAEPEIFSPDWWEMWRFAAEECRKRGMGIGLSGYTIDWPRGDNLFNKIVYGDAEIQGREIVRDAVLRAAAGQKIVHPVPADMIGVRAFPAEGGHVRPGGMDLAGYIRDGRLEWTAPAGAWEVWIFAAPRIEGTLNPVHPLAGKTVIRKFFAPFLEAAGENASSNLNYFFQDELKFGVGEAVWSDDFAAEFQKRKGYDVFEALPALFSDVGPMTAKSRLDYMDVKVALSEERYFIPIFEWHNGRGMIYGCDPEGRGLEPGAYGDNFRVQRWYTAPGHDTPGGRADLIKGKVSSSIAALYGRPRVWLEGYHSLGWGAAPERLMYATSENYLYGCNLLNLHGLYYTTHGSFWEWAPPSYHFRMPYWNHLPAFLKYFERLSFLMSQGTLTADIAIMYPVSPVQARMDGTAATEAAFDSGREIFSRGYDFIFMDDQSLERAEIRAGRLEVSGMRFRALVLPAMKAVRWATIQKALEFKRQGGIVVNVGALPEASDRAGAEDPELDRCVRELFGGTSVGKRDLTEIGGGGNREDRGRTEVSRNTIAPDPEIAMGANASLGEAVAHNSEQGRAGRESDSKKSARANMGVHAGVGSGADDERSAGSPGAAVKEDGLGIVVQSPAELLGVIEEHIRPAVESDPPVRAMHRKAGFRDVYMVMDAERGSWCFFRSKGEVELWDPWTGKNIPLAETETTADGTRVRMPLDRDQAQVIVFTPEEKAGGEDNGARLSLVDRADALPAPETMILDGAWEFELVPTMDNRWGDFRLPINERIIGAEARIFCYAEEKGPEDGLAGRWEAAAFDDSTWPRATHGFGQKFWKLGPLPECGTAEFEALEKRFGAADRIDPAEPVEIAGKSYFWKPYDFSWRWGREGDPGHQGYHGLKEKVTDEFICLGNPVEGLNEILYKEEAGGSRYYLWTNANAGGALKARVEIGGIEPAKIILNGKPVREPRDGVALEAGLNPLLLRYDNPGRGYFVLVGDSEKAGEKKRTPLSMKWYDEPGLIPFDVRAYEPAPAGWYRFTAPPGLRKMIVRSRGPIRVWINGREANAREVPDGAWAGMGDIIKDRRATQYGRPMREAARPHDERRENSAWAEKSGVSQAGGSSGASEAAGEVLWQAAAIAERSEKRLEGQERRMRRYEIEAKLVPVRKAVVAIRVEQERGAYGGSALPEPILLECGPGLAEAGDWTLGSVLENYSGGAWYRKTVSLNREQVASEILLDLGDVVATAEVRINGKTAAVLVCPPWKADLTGLVRAGENRLEVLVYNTLANHFLTIPSRYKGGTLRSGMLGPVKLTWIMHESRGL